MKAKFDLDGMRLKARPVSEARMDRVKAGVLPVHPFAGVVRRGQPRPPSPYLAGDIVVFRKDARKYLGSRSGRVLTVGIGTEAGTYSVEVDGRGPLRISESAIESVKS
jgi:hypothetical protein